MKIATEIKKTWMTKSGKTVTVIGQLITAKDITTDRDEVEEVPTVEIKVSINVEGIGCFGDWVRKMSAPQDDITHYVSMTSRNITLGMTTAQVEIVESVRRGLEQHPIWISHTVKIAKNNREYNELIETNNRLFGKN